MVIGGALGPVGRNPVSDLVDGHSGQTTFPTSCWASLLPLHVTYRLPTHSCLLRVNLRQQTVPTSCLLLRLRYVVVIRLLALRYLHLPFYRLRTRSQRLLRYLVHARCRLTGWAVRFIHVPTVFVVWCRHLRFRIVTRCVVPTTFTFTFIVCYVY